MFEAWGGVVFRHRRLVLAISALLVTATAVWGTGVFGSLRSNGGFTPPGSQSQRASDLIAAAFPRGSADAIVLYRSPRFTVADPAYRAAVTATLAHLPRSRVLSYQTYWSTGSAQFVGGGGHATYAMLRLAGASHAARMDSFEAISGKLGAPGLTERAGGEIPTEQAINSQVRSGIGRAEAVSLPVLLILLVVIFGSLAAASLPLAIGGVGILGSFAALRLLALATSVSIYAINITTILGLGLAIDYGLFMVARFREELRRRPDVAGALARTVATAGRTVAVSGVTVAIALASLMLFPETILRSMGYGGVATVAVDMLAALTVMPALLALLGPRVNALSVRRLRAGRGARRAGGAPGGERGAGAQPSGRSRGPAAGPPAGGGPWYGIARSVMRHPVAYIVVIVIGLLVLGAPFRSVAWGGTDARVLPAGSPPRVVAEVMARDFPPNVAAPIQTVVVFPGPVAAAPQRAALAAYLARLQAVPGVSGGQVTGVSGRVALVSLRYRASPESASARSLVTRIRAVSAPGGARVYVGGVTAQLVDEMASLGHALPWMALVVMAASFVLLFAAFGSVVLPVKAIVMNVASLTATFGAVVWIFQQGHLSGLLDFTATGTIDPTAPILMLALIFGLSMDYEVFLLSRIREHYDVTGDNTAAVAAGLQRTGGIITSLALLLMVVVGAFSASGITFIKLLGVGMLIALVVDATVIRVLLVPATMRLLGHVNWWAPRPLRRLYARYGVREEDGAPSRVPAERTEDPSARASRGEAG